jgi:hypothetical protein
MYKYVDDSLSYEILSHFLLLLLFKRIVTLSSSNRMLINVKKLNSSESFFWKHLPPLSQLS